MPDGSDASFARTLSSIREIPAHAWNALANPDPATFNPFVAHEFLSALDRIVRRALNASAAERRAN